MQRSHWGWGYTERMPPLAEVAPRVTAFFGELETHYARPMDAAVANPKEAADSVTWRTSRGTPKKMPKMGVNPIMAPRARELESPPKL